MTCYIIYSPRLNKFYTGITTESIDGRVDKHNVSFYGKKYTSITDDWELFFTISCENTSQLHLIEKHIKRMKSSIYIRNLKRYPEMVEKLLERFSSNRLSR